MAKKQTNNSTEKFTDILRQKSASTIFYLKRFGLFVRNWFYKKYLTIAEFKNWLKKFIEPVLSIFCILGVLMLWYNLTIFSVWAAIGLYFIWEEVLYQLMLLRVAGKRL